MSSKYLLLSDVLDLAWVRLIRKYPKPLYGNKYIPQAELNSFFSHTFTFNKKLTLRLLRNLRREYGIEVSRLGIKIPRRYYEQHRKA